jgi:hypothetical protein
MLDYSLWSGGRFTKVLGARFSLQSMPVFPPKWFSETVPWSFLFKAIVNLLELKLNTQTKNPNPAIVQNSSHLII